MAITVENRKNNFLSPRSRDSPWNRVPALGDKKN